MWVAMPVFALAVVMYLTGPKESILWNLALISSVIGARVVIGYWANVALCAKAVREIRVVDGMNLNYELHLAYISGAGGINFPAFLVMYSAISLLDVILLRLY